MGRADPVLRGTEINVLMRAYRVMIDARMLIGRFSGVGRVVTRLVEELAKRDGVRVIALCGTKQYSPWAGRNDLEILTSTFDRPDRTADRRLFWEEKELPAIIRGAGIDLFHATWNSGIPSRCPVPTVLTIHDLIPWHHPRDHFETLAQRLCYRYGVRSSARRANAVTTVSEYVRGDVLSCLRSDPRRVVTIPNGVDRFASIMEPRDTPSGPYVLYVGGYERRKNVAGVLEAMNRYWRRFDAPLELRLTGSPASLSADAAEVFRRLPDQAPVRFLGDPPDRELAAQYASAEALLLLSHSEGFGLPVLEAMAHGCPVIAALKAALPEVVGDAGILVNPDEPERVCDAIRRLQVSAQDREELVRRGFARVGAFRWETMAERLCGLYETVLFESARAKRKTSRAQRAVGGAL